MIVVTHEIVSAAVAGADLPNEGGSEGKPDEPLTSPQQDRTSVPEQDTVGQAIRGDRYTTRRCRIDVTAGLSGHTLHQHLDSRLY